MSPTSGRSTLITSAPIKASSWVQVGPDCTCVKSRMRTPSSALPASPHGLVEGFGRRAAVRRAGCFDLSFTTFFEAVADLLFVDFALLDLAVFFFLAFFFIAMFIPSFYCVTNQPARSFRGRERSERSPESMTTGRVVGRGGPDIIAGGYGFRVRRQVGTADLPAPRNDVEVFMTQYSFHFLRSRLCGLRWAVRALSLPAAGSSAALMSVGWPESMALLTAWLNSSGVVTWTPIPPNASMILS